MSEKMYVFFCIRFYSAKEEDLGRGCFSKLVACALFFHKCLKEISHFFNFRGGVRDAILSYHHTSIWPKWHYLHSDSKWSISNRHNCTIYELYYLADCPFSEPNLHKLKCQEMTIFCVICNFWCTFYQFWTT